tara:strand:- start:304 stop:942 length:639 start_codon:yes stop_codon:yes gene_type:complete
MEKELQKRILSSIIITPISLFFIIKGSVFFILFLIIVFFIASLEWFKMVKKIESKILGTVLLFFSFYSVYFLRNSDLFNFLLVFLICITTDIGGYIFGKIFKGPKITKISPNKTYSGMIGSFLLSIVVSYFFVEKYGSFWTEQNFANKLILLFIVFYISSISQIGDLIISYFKRLSKIKNTGNLFPGHGGLLDRIDGMIFAFPFAFLIFKIL